MKTIYKLLVLTFSLNGHSAFTQTNIHVFGLEETDEHYLESGQVDTSIILRGEGQQPPAKFSYRESLTIAVFDQGFLPACVAYSIASAVTIRLSSLCSHRCDCHKTMPPFSAAYIYNQVSGGKSRPISLSLALNLLIQQGICPEKLFPNNRRDALQQPDQAVRMIAATFKFWEKEPIFYLPDEMPDEQYRHELMLNLLRAHVSSGLPVIVGLRCPDDFLTFKGRKYAPGKEVPAKANHAAVVIGYDDASATVEILNSFGTDWGDRGFCRIGYEDFCRMARYGYVVRLNGSTGGVCERR